MEVSTKETKSDVSEMFPSTYSDIDISRDKDNIQTASFSNSSAPSADLLAETSPSTSLLTLRKYQKELAKPALDGKNTIICAPTGCGKTITAAEVCKHLHDKSADPDKFKALFIVHIRHLTTQQRDAFRTHFDEKELGVLKETETLQAILQVKKVVMITAQILVNALHKKEVDVSDFDLLILDECHHTTQEHPFNIIMRTYLMKKKEGASPLPIILGLSASLGVGKDHNASSHIITLCANMDVTVVSHVRENVEDLKKHVHTPEYDEICRVDPRPSVDKFRNIIKEIMQEQEHKHLLETDPQEKGSQAYESWIVQFRKNAEKLLNRDLNVICGYLLAFNNALILYENLRAIDAFDYLDEYFEERSSSDDHYIACENELRMQYQTCHQKTLMKLARNEETNDCPKLKKLVKLLKIVFEKNELSKGLILCRTRVITRGLMLFLNQEKILHELGIKPDCLVGQGKPDMKYTMTEVEQTKVLNRFKEGEINVLVATNIAEEGLNMPACNVVIRFNYVSNEIGTVQSRGRARECGKSYLIVERGSKNEEHEEANPEKVRRMNEALLNVDCQSEDEFRNAVIIRQNKLLDEYEKKMLKKKQNQQLDRASDVEVLCKECSTFLCLGSDLRQRGCHYTCIDPEFRNKIQEKERNGQGFRDTTNLGFIKCAEKGCGKKSIGILVLFKDGGIEEKGYGLNAKQIKFRNRKETSIGNIWDIKQWSKSTFEIPQWEQ
ncbi:probable ATP-dependent RNA helicase DHX58 isoform X2 [Anneissia japonica]|nr:probable ATP-dependent RNA helicase DHX58 isoform X2 [Anneissia japonica]